MKILAGGKLKIMKPKHDPTKIIEIPIISLLPTEKKVKRYNYKSDYSNT